MYGFNQPNRISANYYSLWNCGYDTEEIFVFPVEEKELYDTFLWVGQELAQQESLRKGATQQWETFHSYSAPEGVHQRVLFGPLAQTPNGQWLCTNCGKITGKK